MIDFPENYFEKEKRRSFTVSEVMKRSWAADQEIIAALREICRQNSLRMFACYGTLLGAVREGGFIAWDDDMDIGFVGDDYVRFLDILTNDYADRFNVLNPYTRSWYKMNFTHITNSRGVSFDRDYLTRWHGCPFMTGPDVYPYYYLPADPAAEEYILGILLRIDDLIALNRQSMDCSSHNGRFDSGSRLNENIAMGLVELQHETGYVFSDDRPLDNQLEILYDQVCRVTEEADVKYLVRYDEYTKDRSKKFPKEFFEQTIDKPFENITMPVPIGYDDILRKRFGDTYIVPRQERAAHDYPYYRKQLDGDKYRERIRGYAEKNAVIGSVPGEKSNGKRILFHTSVRNLLIYGDGLIDEIKSTLFDGIADATEEIWWMPEIVLKTEDMALELVAPGLIDEYEDLIQRYMARGGRICKCSLTIEELAEMFDAYRGTDTVYSEAFRAKNLEVTIVDYNDKAAAEAASSDETEKTPAMDGAAREEWKGLIKKENGTRKKAVLYTTSASTLFQYGELMLTKIENVIKTFSEHKDDVVLLWHPDPIIAQKKGLFDKKLMDRYNELVEEFRLTGCGMYDDCGMAGDVLEDIDGTYGDPDPLILKCRDMGKPVMLQDVRI